MKIVKQQNLFQFKDTIYNLSSDNKHQIISIVRISGKHAIQSLNLLNNDQKCEYIINKGHSNQNILNYFKIKPRFANFKSIYSHNKINQNNQFELIDKGIIIYFPKPQSYTGEDVIEFQLHGGLAIQRKILKELSYINNFRLSLPGEFTKRALINNKMNILQVEGLQELLNSNTEQQRLQALAQFQGQYIKYFTKLRQQLLNCISQIEAIIDFDEEILDHIKMIKQIKQEIKSIINNDFKQINFQYYQLIRNGIKIAIIGNVNVGKSSLINILSQQDISIVSSQPGTTRDIISTSLDIQGFPIILYDTAGIRDSTNEVELEGIKRALIKAHESNIIILIIDIANIQINWNLRQCIICKDIGEQIRQVIVKNKNVIYIVNKIDQLTNEQQQILLNNQFQIVIEQYVINQVIFISCKSLIGIELILQYIQDKIKQVFNINQYTDISDQQIITNERQQQELLNCQKELQLFLNSQDTLDIQCEYLRNATQCLGRICGKIDVDEILDNIFKNFCIGK